MGENRRSGWRERRSERKTGRGEANRKFGSRATRQWMQMMSRGGRQAGASSCRRCINTARRAQCSPRNKGEKSVREEAKGPREGLGGGGEGSETSGFAIRFVSGVAARNRSCKQRRIISRFSAVLWPAYELSRLGLTAMNLRVAIDVAFRPRAVKNRGCPPRFAGRKNRKRRHLSISLSLSKLLPGMMDGSREKER